MSGNSCAGYVQFRAGPAIIDRVSEVNHNVMTNDISFVPEYDGFVLEQDVPSQEDKRKMYLLSEKKMEEFQKTLKRFTDTLSKKKVFGKIGIQARNPEDFDIDYVLSIAAKISEWNHKSEDINACRRFARKLCQKATNNKNVLWDLISLAPTDIYGSLISGGFTIVLAAMENHEKLRSDMEQSLVRIPKELSKIRRLSNVHIKRNELHKRADEVLVSIFTVLERIIEKLSRTWKAALTFLKENISTKFKDSGGSVQDALQSLADSISEFNDEAEVCAKIQIGRMEETGLSIKHTVDSTRDYVIGTNTKVNEMESKLKEMCENQNMQLGDHRQLLGFLNRLYSFIASNPAFNTVDGTVSRKYLEPTEGKGDSSRNTELVEGWFKNLGEFEPSPKDHIQKFIEHTETLALIEQDKVSYIMSRREFQDWLGKPLSSSLCVRAETAPDDTINFMSVSTAMLALTLGGATKFVVLSCFCSLRKKESLEEGDSGALGIVKSLNGQLLKIMLERQPLIELPFDQDNKVWKGSTERFKHSCALFKKLVTLLPQGNVVFVLLDSVSRTSGDKSLVDEVAEMILKIGRRNTSVVVKLLVTDPIPSSQIFRMADYPVYVPDNVDGGQYGMNVESMKRNNVSKLQDLEDLREE